MGKGLTPSPDSTPLIHQTSEWHHASECAPAAQILNARESINNPSKSYW